MTEEPLWTSQMDIAFQPGMPVLIAAGRALFFPLFNIAWF
jgi:hypothetical protein